MNITQKLKEDASIVVIPLTDLTEKNNKVTVKD